MTLTCDGDLSSVPSYKKPVAGIGLDSQVYNQEVDVPKIPDSTLKEKADLLDQIHQVSDFDGSVGCFHGVVLTGRLCRLQQNGGPMVLGTEQWRGY